MAASAAAVAGFAPAAVSSSGGMTGSARAPHFLIAADRNDDCTKYGCHLRAGDRRLHNLAAAAISYSATARANESSALDRISITCALVIHRYIASGHCKQDYSFFARIVPLPGVEHFVSCHPDSSLVLSRILYYVVYYYVRRVRRLARAGYNNIIYTA